MHLILLWAAPLHMGNLQLSTAGAKTTYRRLLCMRIITILRIHCFPDKKPPPKKLWIKCTTQLTAAFVSCKKWCVLQLRSINWVGKEVYFILKQSRVTVIESLNIWKFFFIQNNGLYWIPESTKLDLNLIIKFPSKKWNCRHTHVDMWLPVAITNILQHIWSAVL